eukprot:Blabericola_migrator_1__5907@NODE_298_length_10203_cov_353_110695_g245_i0_p3_GENE_NODE_298_length_10203_cov_353_110695_g245_i0NODE_298_length_10203_cov_353_110695_g245_i0_p3_ORF_typecomplete_len362_score47_18_NODE_298_length_10203_cov_353_110695_g245_i01431228
MYSRYSRFATRATHRVRTHDCLVRALVPLFVSEGVSIIDSDTDILRPPDSTDLNKGLCLLLTAANNRLRVTKQIQANNLDALRCWNNAKQNLRWLVGDLSSMSTNEERLNNLVPCEAEPLPRRLSGLPPGLWVAMAWGEPIDYKRVLSSIDVHTKIGHTRSEEWAAALANLNPEQMTWPTTEEGTQLDAHVDPAECVTNVETLDGHTEFGFDPDVKSLATTCHDKLLKLVELHLMPRGDCEELDRLVEDKLMEKVPAETGIADRESDLKWSSLFGAHTHVQELNLLAAKLLDEMENHNKQRLERSKVSSQIIENRMFEVNSRPKLHRRRKHGGNFFVRVARKWGCWRKKRFRIRKRFGKRR